MKLKNSFNEVYTRRRLRKESSDELASKNKVRLATGDYERLLRQTQVAKKITVITAEPAEIKNNSKANKLKEELLKKVGIIDNPDPKVTYHFYLAKGGESYKTPIAFWEGLYMYAKSMNIPEIDNKLKNANEGIEAFLKVFVVPDDEIDVTHGIIEDGNIPIGFITIYNKIRFEDVEEMSVLRVEGETLERIWNRLKKLKSQNPEEFTFERTLQNLNR